MLNCHSPLNEKSIFGSFLKILFGDQPTRKASSSFKQKRRLGFESLESRELLSASPLSSSVFDDTQSPFEQSTSYYIGENSNTNTGINNTVESVLNETIETMLFQTMGGGMMCCESNLGAVAATVETSSLGETTATGLGTQGIVIVERSDENDCGIASALTVTYRLSGTATYGTDYSAGSSLVYHENNGDSYYEGTFVIPENITTYNYNISVLNDSLVESSETITFTLVSATNDCCTEYTVTSSAAFTIQDDDKWKISVETTDDTATERLSDVTQDYGAFKFKRTFSGEGTGTGDNSYDATVVFEMSYDSDDDTSANYGDDYTLQYQNSSGQWGQLGWFQSEVTQSSESEIPPVYHYYFSVTIPTGQTEVNVRLVPVFDWEDEAEQFNPFGNSTPQYDDGEFAVLELIDAYWSGMGDDWETLDDDTEGEIEIKDGAFVSVTSDFNNDGTIDNDDYEDRRGNVGSLIVKGANDIAHYYAWIDVVSLHEFSLDFQGSGGIEYIYSHNDDNSGYSPQAPEILTGDKNSASGIVTIVGADNSTTIASGSLSLSVGGGSDWTRFSVFSITVDMAFNHDRTSNDGTDGINIRTNGSDNTEHYGAELIQDTTATWNTPNGTAGNKTVLYIADKDVTIYNRFVMSLVIPYDITLDLKATTSASIGGCDETTVTFTNGISTGSKGISGVNGFVEFDTSSKTSNKINKESGAFNWSVTKIEDKTTGTGTAITTDPITFYTVLGIPNDPWNTNDTTIPDSSDPSKTVPQDDKIQPWVNALEFTIGTAAVKGSSSPESALSQLTTFLHSQDDTSTTDVVEGYGMTYDTANGASGFGTFYVDGSGEFRLNDYINRAGANVVNCYDQAAAVFMLGRILGIAVDYAYMSEFGYINTVNLVGVGDCNNPFYFGMANPYNVPVVGSDDAGRTGFGNHAFTMLGNDVYDACALAVGISFDDYLTTAIDTSTVTESNVAGTSAALSFPNVTIKLT